MSDEPLFDSSDVAPRPDVRHGHDGQAAEPPRTSTAESGRQADPLKADVQEEPTTSTRPTSAIEPLNESRSEHDERMTVFGYYANIAAEQFPRAVVDLLIKSGYRDPRQVMRELSAWCYANRENP